MRSLCRAGFALNPVISNLSGTLWVSSNSPMVRMDLYLNGTFVGSYNYSVSQMMSRMMGSTPFMYSMMYPAYPRSMPMLADIPMENDKTYVVTMAATFQDQTSCGGIATVRT